MLKDEFPTEAEVRDFFVHRLPLIQKGAYYYQKNGLDIKNKEALDLFQYDGNLIGSGIFYKKEKFLTPKEDDGFVYHGINFFYPDSITDTNHINKFEYRQIDSSFKYFCQSMRKTDVKYLSDVIRLLNKKL